MNLRSLGDCLVRDSILVCKRLHIRLVLDVHFGRKGFGYLDLKRTTYKFIFGVVIILEY